MTLSHNSGSNVVIDPGRLPTWSVASAIHLAYAEATARLASALSLTEYSALSEVTYRFYFHDPLTEENWYVSDIDGDLYNLPFSVAISILALIRLKDYKAIYTAKSISVYFDKEGVDGGLSDVDRVTVLFHERPEFQLFKLTLDKGDEIYGADEEKEENQEKEEEK